MLGRRGTSWACARLLIAIAMAEGQLFAEPDPAPAADVQFIDVSAASGLAYVNHAPLFPPGTPDISYRNGCGAAVADYDNDGDYDVFIPDTWGWPNKLYRNNGDKTFTDVTEEADVGELGASHMALFLDLDNDGFKDLILGNDTQGYGPSYTPCILYRNKGDGTFDDVTDGSSFAPAGSSIGGIAATDYDLDGLLDLYVAFWGVGTNEPFNFFYRNLGDFTFTDVTADEGLRTAETSVRTWAPVFVDVDGDGYQDLFAAVDFTKNYLFQHAGLVDGALPEGPAFVDISIAAGVAHGGNDMGVAVGDCNGDGLLDLYTTNLTLAPPNEQERTNVLFINHGLPEPFTEEAVERGVWQTYWGWGTWFFDADFDTDLDLAAVNGWTGNAYYLNRPSQFFLNDGAGYFVDIAAAAGADHPGDSRGLTVFDYDHDGDEDMLIVDVGGPAVLLENVTLHDHHWLALELTGRTTNRDAIGAQIDVTAAGVTQHREVFAGGSFYAGPPLAQHFGVGAATVVEEIRIRWPRGPWQVLTSVAVDQKLILTEPLFGDVSGDGGVDLSDAALLPACLTGPAPAVATGCEPLDFDNDGDADLQDIASFQRGFGAT